MLIPFWLLELSSFHKAKVCGALHGHVYGQESIPSLPNLARNRRGKAFVPFSLSNLEQDLARTSKPHDQKRDDKHDKGKADDTTEL